MPLFYNPGKHLKIFGFLVFSRCIKWQSFTVWKVSVFGAFLIRIFTHSDWIQRDTPCLSVFSPSSRKYGPEKLRIQSLSMQCWPEMGYVQLSHHLECKSIDCYVYDRSIDVNFVNNGSTFRKNTIKRPVVEFTSRKKIHSRYETGFFPKFSREHSWTAGFL